MSEKTCNQFIHEMRDAGFDFTFTATNNETVIKGECKAGVIKSARQLSADEHKAKIIAGKQHQQKQSQSGRS